MSGYLVILTILAAFAAVTCALPLYNTMPVGQEDWDQR